MGDIPPDGGCGRGREQRLFKTYLSNFNGCIFSRSSVGLVSHFNQYSKHRGEEVKDTNKKRNLRSIRGRATDELDINE